MAKIRLTRKNRRRPGQRANLSRERILIAALELLQKKGVGGFTARRLAARLGVHPQAVLGRFESFDDLRSAAAEMLLADIAPPFSPEENPVDYLRQVFRGVLAAVHGRGAVADLAFINLSKNRLVAPRLLEGVVKALRTAGIKEHAVPAALDLVYATLTGMLAVETSDKSLALEAIRKLPPDEFPALHGVAEQLDTQALMEETAERYVVFVAVGLSLAAPLK